MSEPYRHMLPDGREWIIHDRVIFGADIEVASWVTMQMGDGAVQSLFVALGTLKPDIDYSKLTPDNLPNFLVAGTIFYNHSAGGGRSDIMITVASSDYTSGHPDVVARILAYPFGQLGVRHITAEIDSDNEASIKQAEALGFRLCGFKEGAAGNGTHDIAIYGLKPEWSRFWMRRKAQIQALEAV